MTRSAVSSIPPVRRALRAAAVSTALSVSLGASLSLSTTPAQAAGDARSYLAYEFVNSGGLVAGQRGVVKVRVSGAEGRAQGRVTLRRQGVVLGSAKVRPNGRAVIFTRPLTSGQYKVRLRYHGSDVYRPARSKFLVFGVR